MDMFGIGAALSGCARIYFRSARATGRSTALVDSVKDGDRIIVINGRQKTHYDRMLKTDGKHNVSVVVLPVDYNHNHNIYEGLSPSKGRTVFDHVWVEKYHIRSIDRSILTIDEFETNLSGYGIKHRETKQQAMELLKWRE